jgi:hypothetical protein
LGRLFPGPGPSGHPKHFPGQRHVATHQIGGQTRVNRYQYQQIADIDLVKQGRFGLNNPVFL